MRNRPPPATPHPHSPLALCTPQALKPRPPADLELWYPLLRFREAGANAFTVGPKGGMKYAGKHSYPCVCDRAIDDVTADELDVLIIPGGWAPDYWRRDDRFKKLCVDMDAAGKVIGTICHGYTLRLHSGAVVTSLSQVMAVPLRTGRGCSSRLRS